MAEVGEPLAVSQSEYGLLAWKRRCKVCFGSGGIASLRAVQKSAALALSGCVRAVHSCAENELRPLPGTPW